MKLIGQASVSWLLHLAVLWSIWSSSVGQNEDDETPSQSGPTTLSSPRFLVTLDPKKTANLEEFTKALNQEGISHRILQDLTRIAPDVYFGVSLVLNDLADEPKLERSGRVQKVSRLKTFQSLAPVTETILGTPVRVKSAPYPPHVQTNITQLHQMGFFGQGIKIALLDTGIDCTHPSLGGGFGDGYPFSFGEDLVGDDFDGEKESRPNDTPCTPCADHGTHVAGIVGAADVGFGFTGVAPKATLGMYLFPCGEKVGTSNSILLEAMLKASKAEADIISVSIGGTGGWAQGDEILEVVDKLVTQKNISFFFAAGNEGNEGLFYGLSPASATRAISVGSVDSSLIASKLVTSTGQEMNYYTAQTFGQDEAFPIYRTSNSTDVVDDACDALPSSTPDLSGYIVLMRRGTCTFAVKAKRAKAKGATRVLFYMNSTAITQLPDRMVGVRVAVLSLEDGEYVHKESGQDPEGFSLKFPANAELFNVQTPFTGFISNFSQYGPNYDSLSPEPVVSGVGGYVLSTYPVGNGSYAVVSGTSMATPQLAGIAALVMNVRGKKLGGEIMRSRLATTAKLIRENPQSDLIQTVAHQGGGLVNAYCAAFADFEVTNVGKETLEFKLDHVAAGTVYTYAPDNPDGRPDTTSKKLSEETATVQISPSMISLGPGESKTISVEIKPPNCDPGRLGVYSGYITLKNDRPCENYQVPYYGVAGSLKDQIVLDRGPVPKSNGTVSFPYVGYRNVSTTLKSTNDQGEFVWRREMRKWMFIVYRTNFGSPYLRILLVGTQDSKTDTTSDSSDAPPFSPNFTSQIKSFPIRTPEYLVLGEIPDADCKFCGRSSEQETWDQPWNGTISIAPNSSLEVVPNGRYKILIQALKVFGDNSNPADYETWLSPVFNISD